MSKYGVISGPYFPVFGPEITPYWDTFHAVPVSNGYIKEESFMVFIHGKLRDSIDISKVVAAERFSYILKIFHVTLYVFKALRKFKSFIKNKHYTYLKHYGNLNILLRVKLSQKPLPVFVQIE